MKKYLFQRFLPNCDTDDIKLECLIYAEENGAHMVSISELDEKIDTKEDLRKYLSRFTAEDTIVLLNDRPAYSNPILCDYALKTLKSYLYWIQRLGYRCFWSALTTP